MPSYPKRLIEVDLPIARISAHARREKSIRHGHISTLHIRWARRPLAACRAVICAALWPDPADPLCPAIFREQAIAARQAFAARIFPPRVTAEKQTLKRTASVESLGRWEALAGGTLALDANVTCPSCGWRCWTSSPTSPIGTRQRPEPRGRALEQGGARVHSQVRQRQAI